MKNIIKALVCITILMIGTVNSVPAFDLDETVDDEIRKKYNDTKLIKDIGLPELESNINAKTGESMPTNDLPELPNITKYKTSTSNIKVEDSIKTIPPQTIISYNSGNTRIKKGTTLFVSNSNAISDSQSRGTRIKFTLKTKVQGKGYTIPAWTTFNGEVIESHQPQITCNGGLVSIRIYSMTYKGQTIPINAYVVKANDKKIFLNDIKGSRTYLKTMWKKGGWGRNVFNKMMTLTVKLGAETSTLILSPFPAAYGTICLGLNALTSPITAFFSKGGHVSIPAGSPFKIKFTSDVWVD